MLFKRDSDIDLEKRIEQLQKERDLLQLFLEKITNHYPILDHETTKMWDEYNQLRRVSNE